MQDSNDTSEMDEQRQKLSDIIYTSYLSRLVGEYLGYTEGILLWDIPIQLRNNIYDTQIELNKIDCSKNHKSMIFSIYGSFMGFLGSTIMIKQLPGELKERLTKKYNLLRDNFKYLHDDENFGKIFIW